jgi:hypothetical protein
MKLTSLRKLGKSGVEVTLLGTGGGPLGDMYARESNRVGGDQAATFS